MKHLIAIIAILCAAVCATAQGVGQVRFGNEATDTLRITELLDRCVAANLPNPEARVAFFAREFIDVPYAAHTLEGDTEVLTVRLDSLDCTTFAETVLALAQTAGAPRHSWRDFVFNLQRMRYRGGEMDGYASRLHYNADWIVDNVHRGNLKDAARNFPRVNYKVMNIDFMTRNRDRYPALADSASYARMRGVESGYRNHRFAYVKSGDLGVREVRDAFHNGDVVSLVSANVRGLDTTHMGIVVREADGTLHLLHASLSGGKVMLEQRPLDEFMHKNRQWLGLRVIRLAE